MTNIINKTWLSRTKDPKLKQLRGATTRANNKHGVANQPKTVGLPKPITLPKLKFMGDDVDG